MGILNETHTNKTLQTPGLNPFLPFGIYIPDGEPKVFGDRLYLYGSFDLPGNDAGYCSNVYHTVSAPLSDLTRWTDHGESFSSAAVPWSDALLYAPDALFYRGKYYLFFCMSDGSEGVAESDAPEGPFGNARRITLAGEPISGIDPSVLEDGGKLYYTWGQFHLNVGELSEDLCTLKPGTVHTDVLSNAPGREGFHEGSSLRKLGERYCMIYASEYQDAPPNSGARPTKLDYAVSDTPYGPYERRGTVIDNDGCDPATWNNHGSVIRAGEQWFVFYHASSGNTQFMRRARAERLTVDEANAVIYKARPSANGFVETLRPAHIASPVHACRFFGGAYVTQTGADSFPALLCANGAGFAFSPILFQAGDYALTLRYRAESKTRLRINAGKTAAAVTLPGAENAANAAVSFSMQAGLSPLLIERTDPGAGRCEIEALCLEPIQDKINTL